MNLVSRTNILNTLGGTIMGTEYDETYGQWVRLYSPNGVNYKYSPGFSFAYEGSAGILLGDVISIAFLYSGGTAHKYNMLTTPSPRRLSTSLPALVATLWLSLSVLLMVPTSSLLSSAHS